MVHDLSSSVIAVDKLDRAKESSDLQSPPRCTKLLKMGLLTQTSYTELNAVLEKCKLLYIHKQIEKDFSSQRDSAVSTIRSLQMFYGLNGDTLASAANILDTFLTKMKVKEKHLSCVAVSCFSLAAKLHHETEEVPGMTELTVLMRQSWKASDLNRMELVIAKKLDWNLLQPTCPSFLRIFCHLLTSNNLFSPVESVQTCAIALFEVCINFLSITAYKPATLAVSILKHVLQEKKLWNTKVETALEAIAIISEVDNTKCDDCLTVMAKIIADYENPDIEHPACLSSPKPQPRANLVSRPSYYGATELPTIIEDQDDDSQHSNLSDLENLVFLNDDLSEKMVSPTTGAKDNLCNKHSPVKWTANVSPKWCFLCDIN